jgi:hypothetical protein
MVLGVWVVVAVLASGCGGDDDDGESAGGDDAGAGEASGESAEPGDRAAYVDAIGETLTFLGLTEEEGDCLANVYLDVIGLEEIRDQSTPGEIRETANLTTLGSELTAADGDALYAGANECLDVRGLLLRLVSGGDEVARACLDQAISDDALREAFVGGLLLGGEGLDPEVESSITDAYEQCAAEVAPG